ncbi:hypothetical protein T07_4467 [Trichinella nelsoni]|uniref:Uncharacterized protein n=1 Tax=Trichinella nelsoni TaxID=6336 RepID=A0A0V0RZK4_9BILA|nr:hypothetical protein T07_4467 [Trichinella nelsoni]
MNRAVRLELLRKQEADSFLQGFHRFISCRARPRVIQSDNFEIPTAIDCIVSSSRNESGGNSSHNGLYQWLCNKQIEKNYSLNHKYI